MAIEQLQEPIWERQKGETPNHYCYFLEFLEYPTFNLKEFHKHLCENIQKSTNVNKIVKYQTIRKISSQNKWKERKQSQRASQKDDLMETLNQLDIECKVENYKSKQEIETTLIQNILTAIALGQPLSQINQGIQGLKTLHEDKLLDQEKPTNYNKTDIDAEAKVAHQGVTELLEAFYVSKTEWDKRKE